MCSCGRRARNNFVRSNVAMAETNAPWMRRARSTSGLGTGLGFSALRRASHGGLRQLHGTVCAWQDAHGTIACASKLLALHGNPTSATRHSACDAAEFLQSQRWRKTLRHRVGAVKPEGRIDAELTRAGRPNMPWGADMCGRTLRCVRSAAFPSCTSPLKICELGQSMLPNDTCSAAPEAQNASRTRTHFGRRYSNLAHSAASLGNYGPIPADAPRTWFLAYDCPPAAGRLLLADC